MIDIALDSNADLSFTDDLKLISEVEEIKQAVGITLRTKLGEFFAAPESGLDWEYVIGKDYNQQYAAAAITDAIQQDPRVVSVNDISLNKSSDRKLIATVSFMIDQDMQTTMEVAVIA